MPVKADRVAYPARDHVRTAAVKGDAPYLPIGLGRLTNVTRGADVDVELLVRPQAHEFPAVRLMIDKIVVDDDGLRWVVEVILDLFKLRNLGTFGNVERAVEERQAIRPVQTRGDDFYLTFAVFVDNRIDLVEDAVADEHGALVTEPQRARIRDATGIDLDLEALGQLELRNR